MKALAARESMLYVGGSFTERLASFFTQSDTTINAVTAVGIDTYLAGPFTHIGTSPRKGLARVNLAGAVSETFKPDVLGVSATATALAVSGNRVYVGGQFTSISGTARGNLNTDGSVIA